MVAIFLTSDLVSTLLTISVSVNSGVSERLGSCNTGVLVRPTKRTTLPTLFDRDDGPLSNRSFLSRTRLPGVGSVF